MLLVYKASITYNNLKCTCIKKNLQQLKTIHVYNVHIREDIHHRLKALWDEIHTQRFHDGVPVTNTTR